MNIDPMWQLIDNEIEEQSAVTIWRTVDTATLKNAVDGTVSMVELKPKTGRFHQLRRHMVCIS
jgi:23S rRNA-/tRNA-specific pseudouridylate synthase